MSENKFKIGDTVQDITNNHILEVGNVSVSPNNSCVEYYLLTAGPDGGYWVGEGGVRKVDPPLPLSYLEYVPAKSIPSDGSDGKYYDRTIPKNILEKWNGTGVVSAEDLIYVVFRNDFNFGNSFKSLVRADSFVRGIGKQGNTLKYECNKVHYYTDKIEEQGDNK